MSSLIKSLALLLAIVGLAFASYGRPHVKTLRSLSELGDLDNLEWVEVLRSNCKTHNPDEAFELLKKLDKIYVALGDDAKTNRNEQKIVEQFANNQLDGDQFCTGENLKQLAELANCYRDLYLGQYDRTIITDYRDSVRKYLREQGDNFAFVCRSYVLKNLNKRVGDLNEMYRQDMEQRLGKKLVVLAKSNEIFLKFWRPYNVFSDKPTIIAKISSKWQAVILDFLKEKSGNNLDAKCYITTGDEGRKEFDKLFQDSVIDMCLGWIDATMEADKFRQSDWGQRDDYTEEQARWMMYADVVCGNITSHRKLLAQLLYGKLKSEWSMFPTLRLAMNKGLKKMSHAGVKSQ